MKELKIHPKNHQNVLLMAKLSPKIEISKNHQNGTKMVKF